MNSNQQARVERELDQWLTTAMAALHAALDDVLDLDAGLADAQLPGFQNTLVHALDDVLDLDAGLSHILPTPTPAPSATRVVDHHTAATTLHTFATEFASRPPHDRLTARMWFPRQELVTLRSRTRLAILGHALADVLADAYVVDHALAPVALAVALADAFGGARDDAFTLAFAGTFGRVLARARDYTRDDAFADAFQDVLADARALDDALADSLADALADVFDDTRAHGRSLRTLARALARALDDVLDDAFGRALALALDYTRARADARAVARARSFVRDDILGLARALEDTTPDNAVVDAVDRLGEAVTNVVGADLTEVDLHGIPLAGVRWSRETRWPVRWENQIRRDSVEIEPGLYEIRPGTATGIDTTANAPA